MAAIHEEASKHTTTKRKKINFQWLTPKKWGSMIYLKKISKYHLKEALVHYKRIQIDKKN